MARVQEKITFPVQPANSFKLVLPGRPNGVCTNKEGTLCAVGGRNLLKVFAVEEKGFAEKINLIVGPKKLNYALTDVQWHPIEDNYVASSAGNGVVLLWDLNKVGNESKQDHVFHHHYRFVNKLCFHPSDPALLMSCSQDGNMHLLDIRQKKLVETFRGKSDGIADIQFHPTDKGIFCAACESGNVQLWDMRKPEHHYNQFTAHRGPVFTLNWHPEDRFLLATGGRDTSIKIWNTQQLKTHPVNIIQTIAPVACVKWRPNYKNHIASCALILDNNVTIWDIGRPYVPFATFEEHTDVTTDFVWQKDPDVIISCSKDKLLYNHAIVNAKRPAEDANPVALGFAPNGTVGHALTDKTKRFVNMKSNSSIKSPPPIVSQPLEFKPEKSTLTLYSLSLETDLSKIPDESLIQNLAKEYKFHGKPIGELCQHNADVSIKYGLSEKALTWSILMQLFKNYDSSNPNIPLPSPMSQNSVMSFASEKNRKLETPEMMMGHRGSSVIEEENNSFSDEDILSIDTPNSLGQGRGDLGIGPDMSLAVFDDDGDDGYTNELFSRDPETEGDELDFLPHEGIQVREPLDSGKSLQQHQDSQAELQEVAEQQYRRQHFNGMPTLVIPDWEFKETVKEMLYFYAEKGDIQMSVTTMLVLQHKVRDLIPKDEQEDWYSGYLDILYQFQLFNIATEVINFAPEPINTLNHNMTTIHMQCQMCNKPIAIDKPGCYCKKCEKITQTCAVCQIPVKGLFVWCQGCGHGGHLIHMKEWYKLNTHCPTGCGHKCEYS